MSDTKTAKRIPLWAAILIVAAISVLAFLVFGGANYLQHSNEIDAQIFHHEEDNSDLVCWLYFLAQSGVLGGVAGFLLSITGVILTNKHRRTTIN